MAFLCFPIQLCWEPCYMSHIRKKNLNNVQIWVPMVSNMPTLWLWELWELVSENSFFLIKFLSYFFIKYKFVLRIQEAKIIFIWKVLCILLWHVLLPCKHPRVNCLTTGMGSLGCIMQIMQPSKWSWNTLLIINLPQRLS